jgi:hypothetical protein
MDESLNLVLYEISIWAIPVLIAITSHEASTNAVVRIIFRPTGNI